MRTSVGRMAAAVVLLCSGVSAAQAVNGVRTAGLLVAALELRAPEEASGTAATPSTPPSESAGADAAALEALDAAVKARRERLTWHQVAGFSTEALHLGALVFSILDDHDRFGGGAGTGQWKTVEVSLVGAAVVGTGLTFTLAALAPKPFERQGGLDSNIVHRVLMFAGAGLNVAKLALSLLLYSASGFQGNESLVTLHRITTYAAPACFLAGSAVQVL